MHPWDRYSKLDNKAPGLSARLAVLKRFEHDIAKQSMMPGGKYYHEVADRRPMKPYGERPKLAPPERAEGPDGPSLASSPKPDEAGEAGRASAA